MERGDRFLQEEKYQEAVIEYKNAIQADPRFADAYYQLGLAELALEQWKCAANALQRTIALVPNQEDARVRLGNLMLDAGDYSHARWLTSA